jgi:hypothetical protein
MESAGLETMTGGGVESALRGRTDTGNEGNYGTQSMTEAHSGTMPHRCRPVNLAAPNSV